MPEREQAQKGKIMSFEQEKMIVGSLPSLYPLQKFEEEAINALVSLPIDGDVISRKAAIKEVSRNIHVKSWKDVERVVELMKIFADRIKKLPPAQPPMQSNTSNALKALDSVNATQFNALDSISRQAAINALETTKRIANYELHSDEVLRTFNDVLNSPINIMSLLPPANNSEKPNSSDIIHCKDCKYFKQVFAPNDNDGLCGHWHSKCDARTSRKDYCSHAERKQE
jgi:hypothetical protein